MKRYIFILFAPLFIICSCKKEICRKLNYDPNCYSNDSNLIKNLIIGKWSWMRTAILIPQTPCNTDKNYDYEFQVNGLVRVFDHGTFQQEVPYVFSNDNSGFIIEIKDTAHFEDHFAYYGYVYICNNYLLIKTVYADGPWDYFLRTD